MENIAVIDYKAGNLRSVENALKHLGIRYFISSDPSELAKGDKLLFPGVGHARSAMENLNRLGIADMMRAFAATGKHLFGICLGSQVMLNHSDEGDTDCLGLIEGNTRLFNLPDLKVPHMGWNQVYQSVDHPIFKGIPDGASFYFVHSYYTDAAPENALCRTDYGINYPSGIFKDNIIAVQFHPEKSGENGLKMLKNFADWR
ncbi:MAG: imidazole glycerol phosphate synthase subunit HisH [Deferribacteraceae bacterium]|jgi:glutamine amidotransferase|nr:imidazole glycerol phosphate synthase subunit HisH [Deferribacteraceae bacterium]